MGQDDRTHTGGIGAYIDRWPALTAACATAVIGLIWFVSRSSGGLAFGPWQGLLLTEPFKPGMPLLSHGLAQLHALAPGVNAVAWLTGLSLICATLLCALIAYLAAWQALHVTGRRAAAACGLLAGAGLAFMPTVAYAATGGGPAPLTALLGVISIAFIAIAMTRDNAFGFLALAALFAGLAAANHPSMGILALLLLVPYVLNPADANVVFTRLPALAAVFLAMALLPLMTVLLSGGSLAGFLIHALETAYPTLGDSQPKLGFGNLLLDELPLLALLAAVPAGKLFFRLSTQQTAILMAAVFLTLGPFLPFLTNEHTLADTPFDAAAPLTLALAAVAMFAAWGVTLVTEGVMSRAGRPWLKPVAVGVIAALLFTYQAPGAPDRRNGMPAELTRYLLEACPGQAILVSGSPYVTSLLRSAQQAYGWREDVTIVPAEALIDEERRAQLADASGAQLALTPRFPHAGGWEQLERERPLEVRALREAFENGGSLPESLSDLALWDFVRNNAHSRPLCFVGLQTDWLAARGGVNGGVLQYPRRDLQTEQSEVTTLLETFWRNHTVSRDPAMAQTLTPILLSLSDQARHQNHLDDARELAQWATVVDPGSPDAQLRLTRAAARSGQTELAEKHGAHYLRLGGAAANQQLVMDMLKTDLRRASLETRFESLVEGEEQGLRDLPRRHELAEPLWQTDELAVLEVGYRRLLDAYPDDLDALYHYAAVQAQMGRLDSAHDALGTWVRQAVTQLGMSANEIATALNDDGRFVLLRLPNVQGDRSA